MGHSHVVHGVVVPGDQRGRELGFPTANIDLSHLSPNRESILTGVWAGRAEDGASHERFVTTVSVGRRPTFYDEHGVLLAEAFLLDFDGDLYGRNLVIHLDHSIRHQQSFGNVEKLIIAIESDVEVTRSALLGAAGR